MSALTVEHGPENGTGWDELVRLWEQTDRPEGCTVEIIEGIITVAPPPANSHNGTAERLTRELHKVIPGYRSTCSSTPGTPAGPRRRSTASPRGACTGCWTP